MQNEAPKPKTDTEVERLAESVPDEYHFFVFPAFVVALPLIIAGVLLTLLTAAGGITEVTAWKLYVLVLTFVLVTMGYDFERKLAAIAFGAILVAILLLVILGMSYNENFLGKIITWLWDLPTLAFASFIHIPLYLLMLLDVRLNHRVKAKGETMNVTAFMGDTTTFKFSGNYAPRAEIPDLLEWLIAGLGALRVTDSEGKIQILRRIFKVGRKEAVLLQMVSAVDVEPEKDRI